jgi:hypothetical protein
VLVTFMRSLVTNAMTMILELVQERTEADAVAER